MNQKELTKTFMIILKLKKSFWSPWILQKNSALQGLMLHPAFQGMVHLQNIKIKYKKRN